MLKRCVDAVNAAAGRELSEAELAALERSIDSAAMRLAKADPERWRGLTPEQRTSEAGAAAAADRRAEATQRAYQSTLRALERAKMQADPLHVAKLDAAIATMRQLVEPTSRSAKQRPATFEDVLQSRFDELLERSPDLVVELEGGERLTAREVARLLEAELQDSAVQGRAVMAAADCYLRTGGMPIARFSSAARIAGPTIKPAGQALQKAGRAFEIAYAASPVAFVGAGAVYQFTKK